MTGPVDQDRLKEVTAANASPGIARVYQQINALSGARMPALIYRSLATRAEALEWMWTSIMPVLEDGWLQACARRLMDTLELPATPELTALGDRGLDLDDDAADTIRTIIRTYNRVNPINILVVKTALLLIDGHATTPFTRKPAALPEPLDVVPDPLSLDAMTADCRQAVLRLSAHVPDSSEGVLIPTLYRHLARWPTTLIELAAPIEQRLSDGTLQSSAGRLIEQADMFALQFCSALPSPTPLRPELATFIKSVCDPFRTTIPQLSAVGAMLERGLFRSAASA